MISWSGGLWEYRADGRWIKHGPQLSRYCVTKLGAQFGAWRRRRRAATEEQT